MRVLMWTPGAAQPHAGGSELIERWRAESDACIWIDVDESDGSEQARWLGAFGADPIIVEQALAKRFPPKAEAFGDCVFVLLRALNAEARSIEFQTIQIAFFVGAAIFDHPPQHGFAEHQQRPRPVWSNRARPATTRRLHVALQVTQTVVSRYMPIVLSLEERLGDIEDEMFEKPTDDLLNELLTYKRQLKNVRRIASYHTAICDTLGARSSSAVRSRRARHRRTARAVRTTRQPCKSLQRSRQRPDERISVAGVASPEQHHEGADGDHLYLRAPQFHRRGVRNELRSDAGTALAVRLFRRSRHHGCRRGERLLLMFRVRRWL